MGEAGATRRVTGLACRRGLPEYAASLCRDQREPAPPHAFVLDLGRPDQSGSGDHPQHGLHLEHRERAAEAPPCTPAKGDPAVGGGGALEEALGSERVGLGVEIRSAVHQLRTGCDPHAGGKLAPADPERAGEMA
jgi:hypothetical protein